MSQDNHIYIAIDLKSFYASVECRERKLDPITTNLVVADASRTEKTICLAVSPPLKAYGLSGRSRLFEVVQRVKEVNVQRKREAPGGRFTGSSCDDIQLKASPQLALDYIVAPPRMALYMDYSTRIYDIYMRYIAPEDTHVYSIDEIFLDATYYLNTYHLTPRQLAGEIIQAVYEATGITATAGIGTNLYLCKIAMDIVAKHIAPDAHGVRIAELDEMSYRKILWDHRPITDFWRVGRGYAKKLEANGLFTMGDVARCSLGKDNEYHNEELLYKLFGINAELLIDHAWGWEPCTIADIKAYKPSNNSVGSGQVLHCPYDYEKARLIVREMTELLVLDLVDKKLVTDQMVLTVGYDIENLEKAKSISKADDVSGHTASRKSSDVYQGEITIDRYGRKIPKHAHGSINLKRQTSSTQLIMDAVMNLYERIVNPKLFVRRVNLVANHVIDEGCVTKEQPFKQLDLFTDYALLQKEQQEEEEKLQRERKMQEAILDIKKKFGKNAILKGMNLEEGATTMDRNRQIGGHKA
ncbi:MAG: DNA methylase [Lachnospiraceae bacterium]|nr:DNA methylase [Lachnospiraceae bacterium]